MQGLNLGSVCILLEDLGFKFRDPPERNDLESVMTYHHLHINLLYEKIFADVDRSWVLEVCLVPEELHIDRWHRKPSGLYMVEEDLSVNLCNPKSIDSECYNRCSNGSCRN